AARTGVRVESSPRGRALQQNRGAELAEGSVLLFLHADTHLPDSYVTHVFETLIDPMTSAGAFRFRSDLNRPAMKGIAFLANFRSRFLKLPYGDQGLFVRKPVFDRVGGFPDVPIAEDLFLVRRLAKRGRIRIASADVTTSARRWLVLGLLRTTLINQIIVAGCYLGVSPHTLAPLERNFRHFKHFKL
ncbi:MAG: glycosyltransferase family 2 protein, partial [Pseudomonadota bacterium]